MGILLTAVGVLLSCYPQQPQRTLEQQNFEFCWNVLRINSIFQENLPGNPIEFTSIQALYLSVGDPWTEYISSDSAVIYAAFLNKKIAIDQGQSTNTTVVIDSIDTAIAYIGITSFSDSTVSSEGTAGEFHQALAQTAWAHYTIIDLRNNPGGIITQSLTVAGEFVPPRTPIVITREREYDYKIWPDGRTVDTCWKTVRADGLAYNRQFYVLVNQYTASAAELVVIAIKQYRTDIPIVGTTTFGKARAQKIWYPTPALGMARVSYALLYPVTGANYDSIGIEPSVIVEPTMDALGVVLRIIQGTTGLSKSTKILTAIISDRQIHSNGEFNVPLAATMMYVN